MYSHPGIHAEFFASTRRIAIHKFYPDYHKTSIYLRDNFEPPCQLPCRSPTLSGLLGGDT